MKQTRYNYQVPQTSHISIFLHRISLHELNSTFPLIKDFIFTLHQYAWIRHNRESFYYTRSIHCTENCLQLSNNLLVYLRNTPQMEPRIMKTINEINNAPLELISSQHTPPEASRQRYTTESSSIIINHEKLVISIKECTPIW